MGVAGSGFGQGRILLGAEAAGRQGHKCIAVAFVLLLVHGRAAGYASEHEAGAPNQFGTPGQDRFPATAEVSTKTRP